jgi:uncharacterized protein (TIGR02145 family)
MAFCGNCGKEVKDGAKFCGSCGAPAGAAAGTPAVNRVAVSEPVITSNINLDDVELDEPFFKGLSNVWAWCLAFVPLMGAVLAGIIVMVAPDLEKYAITIGCIPLFLLFYLLDDKELKKNEIDFGLGWVVWGILLCGFLVGPIYLFSRAKNIGKYGYAIASLIVIVGWLLLTAVVPRFSEASEKAKLAKAAQWAAQFVTTFTDDRDAKVYKKITVGNQTWMGENLNYNAKSSVCYENKEANCAKYGRLYDWITALTACPAGFHLPSDGEWTTLTDYVGGEDVAGKKLKSIKGWNKKGNGTDNYGFSALPGGNNYGGSFGNAGDAGFWWNTTEYDADSAKARCMLYSFESAYGDDYDKKSFLFSVRCVQD